VNNGKRYSNFSIHVNPSFKVLCPCIDYYGFHFGRYRYILFFFQGAKKKCSCAIFRGGKESMLFRLRILPTLCLDNPLYNKQHVDFLHPKSTHLLSIVRDVFWGKHSATSWKSTFKPRRIYMLIREDKNPGKESPQRQSFR
jgi:hypothetical protein